MRCGFVTCGPNEALVVSGCCHSKPLLIPGGRAFVWPCIQQVQRILLNTMTLQIVSPSVYTVQGVPISVTGVAQVKIQGQNQEMLLTACEQFLGKTEAEIQEICLATLEGHQRAVMGSMAVEEIYKDRKKFSKQVFEVASSDLINMGMTIVSYTVKDIRDDEGYLKALGMARTAEVKRDAKIGECEAQRDAQIKEVLAEEEKMAAKYVNDMEIEKCQRDFEIKKALYDKEVQAKKAEAELAYELQATKIQKKIREEEMQIKVIERKQEIQLQAEEVLRKENELESTIRQPVIASKLKMEKLSQSKKKKTMLEAEAEADALRMRSEAEAHVTKIKACAEADQMACKAEAWKEYKDAAILDMMLNALPKLAAEVAAPIAQAKKLTMVSCGEGEIGVAKLTKEILDVITKMPSFVQQLTGINILRSSSVGIPSLGRKL